MIEYERNAFRLPGAWSHRARSAPERTYQPAMRSWLVPDTAANRRFLKASFLSNEFSSAARDAVTHEPLLRPEGTRFPTQPEGILPHQQEGLDLSYQLPCFAFFHEMGSGKSRTLLELWQQYFKDGLITEGWLIVPNSIIGNWHEQIQLWTPNLAGRIQVYGVLSLSQGKLPIQLVQRAHDKLAVGVDESQRIKNSSAKRTRTVQEIGKHAAFRHIATGTEITKGIEDLYAQFNFLDPNILGFKSFYSFRNRYCIMGGFDNKQIVGYQNLPELMKAVAPYTHKVRDPVELPPMGHEDRVVALSPQQKELLRALKDQMSMEMAGTRITVDNALAYYTRAAQILGGFFPIEKDRYVYLDANPKLEELIELFEATDKKIVVFCRFIPEAKLLEAKLRRFNVVRLGSDIEDRQGVVNKFQNDPEVQGFISTYAMGAIGFTLTRGKILTKYSGTFNYEDEVQSEKRIHRIGQTDETMAIRILADCKLDRHIKAIAQQKQTLADFVSGALSDPKALLSLLDE